MRNEGRDLRCETAVEAEGLATTPVLRAFGLALVVLSLVGCRSSTELEVTYGQRRDEAGTSVNGTSILANMFDGAGCKVYSWRYLTPQLQRYDVIVWAPDDFGLPDAKVLEFFDEWLASDVAKTLVYIGRDYNAASQYWDGVMSSAPAEQRIELLRRRARAAAEHDAQRLDMPTDGSQEWFTMRRDEPRHVTRELSGPWSEGIDVTRTDIRTQGLLQTPTRPELLKLWNNTEPAVDQQPDYEVLLGNETTSLVSRVTKPAWGDGQVIVVANGSFLLNLPLVNHEHRKLASYLIRECGPGTKVAFLESGPGGPSVVDSAHQTSPPESTRRRALLAAHWFVLGLVYCFCIYPIFGRPKSLPDDTPSEFVQHVEALGELLERTQDEPFARKQIESYSSLSRRDSSVPRPIATQQPGDSVTAPAVLGPPDYLEQAPSPKSDANS
ncbi:MAG: DUF4350 domain-containing protein [Pirellulaceae bacterium]